MFVLKQRFANDSSNDNSDEDVSEGDLLQVTFVIVIIKLCIKYIHHVQ